MGPTAWRIEATTFFKRLTQPFWIASRPESEGNMHQSVASTDETIRTGTTMNAFVKSKRRSDRKQQEEFNIKKKGPSRRAILPELKRASSMLLCAFKDHDAENEKEGEWTPVSIGFEPKEEHVMPSTCYDGKQKHTELLCPAATSPSLRLFTVDTESTAAVLSPPSSSAVHFDDRRSPLTTRRPETASATNRNTFEQSESRQLNGGRQNMTSPRISSIAKDEKSSRKSLSTTARRLTKQQWHSERSLSTATKAEKQKRWSPFCIPHSSQPHIPNKQCMYRSSKSDRYLHKRLSEKMSSQTLNEDPAETHYEEIHLDGTAATPAKQEATLTVSDFLVRDSSDQHFTPQLPKKLPFVPPEFIQLPDLFEI